ncbi:hypothetical protein PAXRUDRAFT_762696, partial [Paxillus rubicundulus Ve08.2h10]
VGLGGHCTSRASGGSPLPCPYALPCIASEVVPPTVPQHRGHSMGQGCVQRWFQSHQR